MQTLNGCIYPPASPILTVLSDKEKEQLSAWNEADNAVNASYKQKSPN